MIAKDKRGDADFCHNSSMAFAEAFNKATSSSNDGAVVDLTFSVEVSFAREAVATPLIEDDQSGGNGATSITCILHLPERVVGYGSSGHTPLLTQLMQVAIIQH